MTNTADSLGQYGKFNDNALLPVGVSLGPYTVTEVMGCGADCATYRARDVQNACDVVLKEFLPVAAVVRERESLRLRLQRHVAVQSYAAQLARFEQVPHLLSSLQHPNIVSVKSLFRALGTSYYVMPFIEGRPLEQAAPPPELMSERWLLPVLMQLLDALENIHAHDALHRNIRPDSILLQGRSLPILTSFGMKTEELVPDETTRLIPLPPPYVPSELDRLFGTPGPWSDLYSLGATCYRLILGKEPPLNVYRTAELNAQVALANNAALYGRFSRQFLDSIDKAMSCHPEDRWQTAAIWKDVLAEVVETLPLDIRIAASNPQAVSAPVAEPISRSETTVSLPPSEPLPPPAQPAWDDVPPTVIPDKVLSDVEGPVAFTPPPAPEPEVTVLVDTPVEEEEIAVELPAAPATEIVEEPEAYTPPPAPEPEVTMLVDAPVVEDAPLVEEVSPAAPTWDDLPPTVLAADISMVVEEPVAYTPPPAPEPEVTVLVDAPVEEEEIAVELPAAPAT
ncbi:MAG: protein kinase, partial [Akkermansia sp.]|nr:protein kinase [Akkermansia sp.]